MTADEISRELARDVAAVIGHLTPDARLRGHEAAMGDVQGSPGDSLRVRLTGEKAGIWSDFATGQSGDVLDFWAANRGVGIAEAMTEAAAFLNLAEGPSRRIRATAQPYKRPERPRELHGPAEPVLAWLASRGLTPATIAAFRIAQAPRTFEGASVPCAVFPYLRSEPHGDKTLINYKIRDPAEKRHMQQAPGAEPCLFGWHLIAPTARQVTITEGEIDAMTLHQQGIAALSVPAGAGNHQWIAVDYEALERFSDIVIAFDHDEAGEAGAAEVIRRLGAARCRRMQLPTKDANEWLMAGAKREQFEQALREAKPCDPPELRDAEKFLSDTLAIFFPSASTRPAPVLRLANDLEFLHFRPAEVSLWSGVNGSGKSVLLSQVELGLMEQGEIIAAFSGEMAPKRQLARMVRQATGLHRPTQGYVTAAIQWLAPRRYIYDCEGSTTLARLLEVFEYATRRYGVTQCVIDSLMMLEDVPEDGPGFLSAQKKAMATITDFAKRTGVHVHLVAHPRKGASDKDEPGKSDIAGSSKLTDFADNVLIVMREPKEFDLVGRSEKPDGTLILKKQRNGDAQQMRRALWFDVASMQYRMGPKQFKTRFYVPYEGAPVPPGPAADVPPPTPKEEDDEF